MVKHSYRAAHRRARIAGIMIAVYFLLLLIGPTPSFGKDDVYAEIDNGMDRFSEVYRHVVEGYYEEVDPGDLIKSGIDGMLSQLDPYTQFLDERAAEQLRIDTTGKFGGLGITIILKDRAPTVMSVMHGTPAERAGLFAGDRIMKIEGDPTEGKGLDEVVSRLRGDPGTTVRITIEREEEPRPLEFSIIREDIKIVSVAFSDTLGGGIGYLSMARTRFSDHTDEEVAEALTSLKAKGAKGIILDLRGNPGGLLPQAIKVANTFLDKGKLIVSTKGRTRDQNRDYVASEGPVVRDLPLIVLVDGSSASASEIVAGAIQDSDRGLIVGTSTFGKGSVQAVLDIDQETKLKLTTALYYTPSGRSIHKSSNGRGADFSVTLGGRSLPLFDILETIRDTASRDAVTQSLVDRFNLTETDVETLLTMDFAHLADQIIRAKAALDTVVHKDRKFTTTSGRTVYGREGITPDVTVEQNIPRFAEQLERRRLFFSFAVHYVATHQIGRDFDVDDRVTDEFKAFVADPVRKFNYESAGEQELKSLMEVAEKDSGYGPKTGKLIQELSQELALKDSLDFQESLWYIKGAVKREIASRLWGSEAQLRAEFLIDAQLKEAVAILKDPVLYAEKMKGMAVVVGKGKM